MTKRLEHQGGQNGRTKYRMLSGTHRVKDHLSLGLGASEIVQVQTKHFQLLHKQTKPLQVKHLESMLMSSAYA